MATKPVIGTSNLPAPQTHKGCCDKFLAGLQQIKRWACTFFQGLFCCNRSEKPLSPTKVQKTPPARIEKQEGDQEKAIGTLYCRNLIKVFQETTPIEKKRQVLNRSGLALLRCMTPQDQVSLLRSLAPMKIINDWTPFIRLLPPAVQEQLDPNNPNFDAVDPQPEPLTPEKLFLHGMLVRLFGPQAESPRFFTQDIETFATFSAEQQFFIIYTLAAIGMDDKLLKTTLNYTEISKLINHSKFKAPLTAFLQTQSPTVRSSYYVMPTFDFDSVSFMITSESDLTAHFQLLEGLAVQAPWNTLLGIPLSADTRAFIGRYCTSVSHTPKTKAHPSLYLDGLHTEILKILVKPEDQFFLLQQLASNHYVDTWYSFINGLPDALKDMIFAKLAEQIKVDVETVYNPGYGGKMLNSAYATVEKLGPVFAALAKERSTIPLTYVEQFLQEMVFQLCGPNGKGISYSDILPLPDQHKQRFKAFSRKDQAIVIFTIMTIDRAGTTDNPIFNNLVTPLLNALFDSSVFQEETGSTPLVTVDKKNWFHTLQKEAKKTE